VFDICLTFLRSVLGDTETTRSVSPLVTLSKDVLSSCDF